MSAKSKNQLSSQKLHQRQMLVQVWLPLGIALAAFIFIGILVILSAGQGSEVVTQAANISIIYLLLPVILMGLMYAMLVGLAIFLVAKLTGKITPATRSVQGLFSLMSNKILQISSRLVDPYIKTSSRWSAVKSLFTKH